MVRDHPDPPRCFEVIDDEVDEQSTHRRYVEHAGGLAQLVEHLLCKQGVVGSIPSSSTKNLNKYYLASG
jgi:hypothetical protein